MRFIVIGKIKGRHWTGIITNRIEASAFASFRFAARRGCRVVVLARAHAISIVTSTPLAAIELVLGELSCDGAVKDVAGEIRKEVLREQPVVGRRKTSSGDGCQEIESGRADS